MAKGDDKRIKNGSSNTQSMQWQERVTCKYTSIPTSSIPNEHWGSIFASGRLAIFREWFSAEPIEKHGLLQELIFAEVETVRRGLQFQKKARKGTGKERLPNRKPSRRDFVARDSLLDYMLQTENYQTLFNMGESLSLTFVV